jgi:acyl-CoA thioesterase II
MSERTMNAPEFELAADGVPRGQAVLDALVRLLDLEQLEVNLFRGVSPPQSPTRVFGGQVAGQALVAAGRTVPEDRAVHSLHAYFIRPGDPRVPIIYQAERVRDGRSFTTRRVLAIQHGEPIFALSASFQLSQEGLEHSDPGPTDLPAPESLPTLGERVASGANAGWLGRTPRPLDMRFVDEPSWSDSREGGSDAPRRVWMRADGTLPDDPLLHVCLLTYASDLTLLGSVLARHDVSSTRVQMASLDHAMWFHRPFRADEWLLYTCYSPTASGSRGLATGRFTTRDGRHVATTVQEGLVRIPRRDR